MKRVLRPIGHLRLRALRLKARIVRRRRPHTPGKGRMRNFGVNRKRYLAAVPLLLGAILLTWIVRALPDTIARFHLKQLDTVNPLMGWAVDAELTPEAVPIAHSLVYATVTWRELEPVEGAFDFETFEKKNHLDLWWKLNKRLVLRFVMDAPGEAPHCDLPGWLTKQLGAGAGAYYTTAAGSGFSPDYTNILLMSKHEAVIRAIGERYDDHPGVAFVEIGSLGHDGTWETDLEGGMPLMRDTREYMRHYLEAFPTTPLVAALPFQPARLMSLGLYCAYLGDAEKTWDWLDLVEFGGYDEGTMQELRAIDSQLLRLPSGAHIGRGVRQTRLFTRGANELTEQLRALHTTYAAGLELAGMTEAMLDTVLAASDSMGYRLWIREAKWQSAIRAGYRLRVAIRWRNDGVQPFSQAWPLELSLCKEGEIVYRQKVDADIRAVTPGDCTMELEIDIPASLRGNYDLGVAILDPRTNAPAVALAMDARRIGARSLLGTVTVF